MPKQTKILSFDEARAQKAQRPSKRSASDDVSKSTSQKSAADYSRYNSTAASQYSARRNSTSHSSGRTATSRASASRRSSAGTSGQSPVTRNSSRNTAVRTSAQVAAKPDATTRRTRTNSTRSAASRSNRSASLKSFSRKTRTAKGYEVRNSWDTQEQEENFDQEQANHAVEEKKSLKDQLVKKTRSAKAERQFKKTVGSDDGPQESSSRAALYEMKMGRTHKRSAEMQNQSSGKRSSGKGSKKTSGMSLPQRIISSKLTYVFVGLIVFCFALYGPLKEYYTEVRQVQQLEAEQQALQEHNEQLQAEVDYLQTDEGMEEYARDQYGLIGADEKQVIVEGVTSSVDKTEAADATHTVLTSGVKTPSTWYSGVLDVIFGYTD